MNAASAPGDSGKRRRDGALERCEAVGSAQSSTHQRLRGPGSGVRAVTKQAGGAGGDIAAAEGDIAAAGGEIAAAGGEIAAAGGEIAAAAGEITAAGGEIAAEERFLGLLGGVLGNMAHQLKHIPQVGRSQPDADSV